MDRRIGLTAFFTALTLCGAFLVFGARAEDANTGEAPDYGGGALTFLGLVRDGNVDEAYAYFSDEVSKMLKPSQLKEIWQQLLDKGGPFEGFGTPAVSKLEKYHAADVPVRFRDIEFTLRVAWDDEGAIAGFSVRGMRERAGQGESPSPPPAKEAPAPPEAAPPDGEADFLGHWEGKVQLPAGELPLLLDLARDEAGLGGSLDSPQQGARGLRLSDVRFEGGKLRFGCPQVPGNAEFVLRLDGGKLAGTLAQGGVELPLAFSREKLPEPARPQTPRPPFPYKDETVGYENGDVHLEGTLTIPSGKGPFPAALMISGSGAQNRDEELFGHRPFAVLADDLTRAGIAVLRVDDRGVGGSTGGRRKATSADYAGDAAKGVDFLRSRSEIDPRRIGLIGHSEGGFIAPMIASQSKDVAFVVLLAGTGVPGDEIIERQTELIYRVEGVRGDSLRRILEEQRETHRLIKSGADSATVREAIRKMAMAEASGGRDGEGLTDEQKQGVDAQVDRQVSILVSPWFRFFLTTDPRPFLRKVTVPVLAMNGALDLQVEPAQNLPEIQRALEEAGNKDVTAVTIPGLNHLFQAAQTGSPNEYATIEETINPEALKMIREWILARFATK